MENSGTKIIEIVKGNEYRILVDDIYDKSKFFYSVYQKSAELINEICRTNHQTENKNEDLFVYPNNIIMFCAERGGGKSSAMVTFARALKDLHNPKAKEKVAEFTSHANQWSDVQSECVFSVLDVIDPTLIGEKEMFMRIILSRMFSTLREYWKNKNLNMSPQAGYYRNQNKNEVDLVNKFKKCYRLLDAVYQREGKFNCEDDLEELTDLGDSSNLKEEFKNLVEAYLNELIVENNSEAAKKFLVLQIDDTDLNTKMAYNIIEDIRKYCIIPNVVILMAVNIEQMSNVIEQHFVSDFKTLLDTEKGSAEKMGLFSFLDCQNMTEKYINKVMPEGHQIHLPRIDDFIRNNPFGLTVKYVSGKEDALEFKTNDNQTIIFDFQERLIRLIYNKTGIALIKPQDYLHNLLPSSMRELSHFLSYMDSLPDLKLDSDLSKLFDSIKNTDNKSTNDEKTEAVAARSELEKRRKNLNAFEQYFIHNWCKSQLSKTHRHIINDLANTASPQKVAAAIKWIDFIIGDPIAYEVLRLEPGLSPNSYALLLEKIKRLSSVSRNSDNTIEMYKFEYALRFYFTLFFTEELLLCGFRGDFEPVFRVGNYEFWEPYNSMHNGWAKIGRFEVNYKVLGLLSEKQKLNIYGVLQGLKKSCYISCSGVNHSIDEYVLYEQDDLDVSDIAEESYDSMPKIIFDFGYEIFSTNITENYFLAFSWDIQHFLEKVTWQNNFGISSDLGNRDDIILSINDEFNKISYLPSVQINNAKINKDRQMLQVLQFSNYQLTVEYINGVFDLTNSSLETFEFKNSPGTFDGYSREIKFALNTLGVMNNFIKSMEILSAISGETRRMMTKWNRVFLVSENYNIMFTSIINSADIDAIKKEFESFVQEITVPFDEFKAYMKNAKTKKAIFRDIDKVFAHDISGSGTTNKTSNANRSTAKTAKKPSARKRKTASPEGKNPPATGDTAQSEAKQKGDT